MIWSSSVFHPCCLQIHHRLPPDLGFALYRNPNRAPELQTAITLAYRFEIRRNLTFRTREKIFASVCPLFMLGWANSEFQNSAQKIVCRSSEVSTCFLKFLQNFHRPHLISVWAEIFWCTYSSEADWEKKYQKNKSKKKEKLISTSASTSRRAPLRPIQCCLSYPYLILILLVTITVLGHI